MVGIGSIKIAKKTYQFDIRRKFVQSMRFVKKTPSLQDQFKRTVSNMQKSKGDDKKKPSASGTSNTIILVGTVMLAIFLIGIAFIYFTIQQVPVKSSGNGLGPRELSASIQESFSVSDGDRLSPRYKGYILANNRISGLSNVHVHLLTYKRGIPQEVFIYDSERTRAEGFSDFERRLTSYLELYGIHTNTISRQSLVSLQEPSIIVVPSGYIPSELLGMGNPSLSIPSLLEKGHVIIYLGRPFDKYLSNGSILDTPRDVLVKNAIRFDTRVPLQVKEPIDIFGPAYQAMGPGNSYLAYGAVSIIEQGNGTLVVLPQTLDEGWRNADGVRDALPAADDVSEIIIDAPWSSRESEIVYVPEENQTSFFSPSFAESSKQVRMIITGIDVAGFNNSLIRNEFVSPVVRGNLYIEGGSTVIPNEISQERTRFIAQLKETTNVITPITLLIYKNGELAGDQFAFGGGPVEPRIEVGDNLPINLDTGEYLGVIVDEFNRPLAQGYFKVAFVTPVSKGGNDGKFYFAFEKDKTPVKLRQVKVTIDNNPSLGTYTFNDVSEIVLNTREKIGSDLTGAPHKFTFEIGSIKKTIQYTPRSSPSIFSDPLFYGVVILAFAIIGIGVYFAKREEVKYQIDVPDFPPIARTKITLSKEQILSVFDKVNETYQWKFTPLTLGELKNGFKKIMHQGSPLFITDYNAEYLMNKLIFSKDVIEYLGYYMPSAWVAASSHTQKYLAFFRKIRDLCVNNAIPFTLMDESSDYDTKITVVGQEMYIHFFDREMREKIILRSLLSLKKGMTVIVFRDPAFKRGFEEILSSPASRALTLAKMELENGTLQLLTIEELEALIKELQ